MYVSVCICDKKANDLAVQCIHAKALFSSSFSFDLRETRKSTVDTKTSDEQKKNANKGNHTERNEKKTCYSPKEKRIESNNPSGFLLQTVGVCFFFHCFLVFALLFLSIVCTVTVPVCLSRSKLSCTAVREVFGCRKM